MAPRRQTGAWLAFAASMAAVQARTTTSYNSTAFWTYTSRFQYSYSTSLYTFRDGSVDTDVYTTTRTIKSGVTPSATPASVTSSSYGGYYYSYNDLQIVDAYYDPGAVAESDLSPTGYLPTRTTSTGVSTYTEFRMPVTYTAPVSCPTQFTVSLNETVSVPTDVRDQVTPTTVVTGSTETFLTYGPTVTETWFLTTGAAPLHTESAFNYEYYVADCSTPYVARTTSTSGSGSGSGGNYRSGGGSSSSDLTVCSWYSGCTSLKTWIIIIASIIPGLFLLGFLESYFWFRRLMLGKGALRFGTISWICISLWVACFTRTQSARSADDQKLLRENWNKTSSGTAFKLWWKWGFRHAYPVPLLGQYSRNTVGIVPEGQPLPTPGMAQAPGTGPVYGPGYQPPPGMYFPPNGAQQQPYYPPPQGWVPPPNGQGYPNPVYYGEQPKDGASVTERTVSPPLPTATQSPPPGVSPPSTVSPPPPNVAEAPPSPLSEAPQPVVQEQTPGGPPSNGPPAPPPPRQT